MIEQLSNSLLAFCFFADGQGVGVTGLTVTVDAWRVVNSGGTPSATQILNGLAATEIGGGLYARIIDSANVNAEGGYVTLFKTTSTLVCQRQMPALWMVNVAGVEHLDENISAVAEAINSPLTELTSITINGQNLVSYGNHLSEELTGSVFELTIPRLATHIALQATDEDIFWTTGDDDPSTSNGFTLYAGNSPEFYHLDEYRPDQTYKFLRSADGANLQYRFYRPER